MDLDPDADPDPAFFVIYLQDIVSPRADLFYQLLAATRRRRKITKPLTLGARTPFNQASNFGCARPFQSSKQL
jgi:hypothetical protein